MPTFCAIAGEPDMINKLKKGYVANSKTYKVHLDGYDQSTFLRTVSGTVGNNNGAKSARNTFFYSDDDGMLVALRVGDYKLSFAEQRMIGTMGLWAEPFTKLRLQKIYNLMQDPYERADYTSNTYWDWVMNHVPYGYASMEEVTKFAATFKEFPPRSIPPSFSAATIMEEVLDGIKKEAEMKKAIEASKKN
jgi:arylsulfatase